MRGLVWGSDGKGMETSTLVRLEEYLRTTYEPDRKWVEGELRERSMPDEFHSAIQRFFPAYFESMKRELGVRVRPELRLHVSKRRYRVPDVPLLPAIRAFSGDSRHGARSLVLSPDDGAGELQEKIEDYVAMNVGAIWIVDPRRRKLFIADARGMLAVESFHVPNSEIRLTDAEIFEEFDELQG